MTVVDRSTPLWVAARTLLGAREEDFRRRINQVLENPGREEIHDLRVSSRRLREALILFSACYPQEKIAFVTGGVKRVTGRLGEIRTADEAAAFLASVALRLEAGPRQELQRLEAGIAGSRARRIRSLGRDLREMMPRSLHDRHLRILRAPRLFAPPRPGADLLAPLVSFVGTAFDARISAIAELLPQASLEEEIEAQHRLRIAFKHFRYRFEILGFLVPSGYDEIHAALKKYQDLLGEMHDLDDFSGIVRKGGLSPETEATVLELMGARRRNLFLKFLEMLDSVPPEPLGERVRSLL